jgi:hypothetical protein
MQNLPGQSKSVGLTLYSELAGSAEAVGEDSDIVTPPMVATDEDAELDLGIVFKRLSYIEFKYSS